MPDLFFYYNGNIAGIEALSDEGLRWLQENCEADPYQWHQRTLYVDWRYAEAIRRAAGEELVVN